MNEILNKMLQYGLISNATTGGDYVLNNDFQKKVIEKLGSLNCIVNYVVDIETDAKKGVIPFFSGITTVISPVTGAITQLNLKDSEGNDIVSITQSAYEQKELISYIPVNNTTLSFAKGSFENMVALYFAKTIAKTLNKMAWDALKAKQAETLFTTTDFENALINNCLVNPAFGRIFVGKSNISQLISTTSAYERNGEFKILNIPVLVCDGLEGIVVMDCSAAMAHVHNSQWTIGSNTAVLFNQNQTMLTLKSLNDLVALDTNAYKLLK